jgi:putative membrane-bound dehydrogenase-like protein
MAAAEAAAKLRLPPGFKASVFAAEPNVQNPIAMTWDGRGRLWIAENYTYAENRKKFELNLRDRVLILDDKDSDGNFDSRTVFTDEVQMLTSIEVGLGGVWLMCPPQLLFIPDRNRDDVPDSMPEVLLDGFIPPPENYHNFANGLRFGPDGWLYGRCGASSPGEIGAPGTPAVERIPLRGTIWRYHPQRKVFESLSCGTTNPWGHDWNEFGELFFINTVNGHLWHHFAGAHFMRPHTIDPNPRAYSQIDQHADHWHFDTAEGWGKSRDGKADAFGGGHAHVGMMIYLGDNWPAQYRGRLFTWNMHGHRVNQEILERRGSGYVGRHGPDFFVAGDPWFRGMELSYGPDGGVFVLDWSDTGECHESTGVHRTSGRIYKITYGEPKRNSTLDSSKLSAIELVNLHTNSNEWFTRQARIELAARAATGSGFGEAAGKLRKLFEENPDAVIKLRALWSLYSIGAADEQFLFSQLRHPNEHVRTWAIRLLNDHWTIDTVMSQRPSTSLVAAAVRRLKSSDRDVNQSLVTSSATLDEMIRVARTDSSALVRLALASTLQRLPISKRADLASGLVSRKEDADDHNLPLLIWYGLIPVADADSTALSTLAAYCELPITRKFIARRLAEDIEKNPAPLNALLTLAAAKPADFQGDIINGMAEGLVGWRKANKPAGWDAFAKTLALSPNADLRTRTRDLNVLFGDGRAIDEVKKVALDSKADLNARKVALQTLIGNRPADLRQICEQLIEVRFLNPVAARGLALYDDPAIGAKLVKAYRQFHPSERPQLLATLVSRPIFARALLDAVTEGKIPRAEISVFDARQIRTLNDGALNKKLADAWGEFREPSDDKQKLIANWKTRLTPAALAKADKSKGREAFNLVCASCHRLYGEGATLGPDLTGAGRDNLDYLLENILDPSAIVPADFRMSVIALKDGRAFNGLVAAKTDRTLTLRTTTESLTFERSEITSTQQESTLSMMPDGLLEALTPEQARDLIAYLMHPSQVSIPIAGR